MNLYVGNLPWSVNDAGLRELFIGISEVILARVVVDSDNGRRIGFVEVGPEDGQRAIAELDGHKIGSTALRVSEAKNARSVHWPVLGSRPLGDPNRNAFHG